MAASMSARFDWPWAWSIATTCSLGTSVRPMAPICWPTTPSKMMLVASPSSLGPMTDRTTLTTAKATTRTTQRRSGRSSREQAPEGGAEVLRLRGGHAHARARSPARHRAGRPGPGRTRSPRRPAAWPAHHAASSSVTCERTISRYVSQEAMSSSWVPMPATAPSSRTTMRSASQDGAHALGHDDDRGVVQLSPEGRPQAGVGAEVEGGEAVVEDVDVRPLDERPGDGQALALAAGDVGAALGDRAPPGPPASRCTKSRAWATSRACQSSSSVAPRRRSAGCWPPCR